MLPRRHPATSMNPVDHLVDTHCHANLYASPESVVAASESAGIYTIAVTNAPSVFFHTKALSKGKVFVRAALGLHPELVRTHGNELAQFEALLKETRYVGEVGLDYSTPDKEERRRQQEVFAAILEQCSQCGDKVLSVHSRRAAADVIAAIGSRFRGTAILHWFSGSLKELRTAVDYGMYFSVNPTMIESKSGQKLIAEIPCDRVLTETDGPFVKVAGGPAEPKHVGTTLGYLASIWNMAIPETRATVAANLLAAVREF